MVFLCYGVTKIKRQYRILTFVFIIMICAILKVNFWMRHLFNWVLIGIMGKIYILGWVHNENNNE